jgi:HipA-like protein
MINIIKKWFSKGEEDYGLHVPQDEEATFILKVDKIKVGTLRCEKGEWIFSYDNEFKANSDEYTHIVGFPNLEKEYRSETLWPFFRIRIPGLKQPAIQEVLQKENIEKDNEVALLKRFGRKTISNPYLLVGV